MRALRRPDAKLLLPLVLGWFLADAVTGARYAPLGVLGLWFGYGCPNPARAWWRSAQAKRENR